MNKTVYLCQNCGYESVKWLGKCPNCQKWNTLEEKTLDTSNNKNKSKIVSYTDKPISLNAIQKEDKTSFLVGIEELDRVLGNILSGQVILLSGEPGVGKSTMLLSIAETFAKKEKVFYLNGEESYSQIKNRADRLGIQSDLLYLYSENSIEKFLLTAQKEKPKCLIIDSIQTIYSEEVASLSGSITQIKECTKQIIYFAKKENIPVFIVSHINKGGDIAGPKLLEHMVDTVLFLETDLKGRYRILRSLKNRFFTTDEIGFFEMNEKGMQSMQNFDTYFAFEEGLQSSGITFFPHLEGNRTFLVEIQALCNKTQYPYPKRTVDGTSSSRIEVLLAILEKKLKLPMSSQDVFINITGGLYIDDPALDLPLMVAIYSAYKNLVISNKNVFLGEIGLAGEIRPVKSFFKRISDLKREKMEKIFYPASQKIEDKNTFSYYPAKTVEEVFKILDTNQK